MSGRKRRYRLVGGPLDGEIYPATDEELDDLRTSGEANSLELMPDNDPGDSRNTPIDQPDPERERPKRRRAAAGAGGAAGAAGAAGGGGAGGSFQLDVGDAEVMPSEPHEYGETEPEDDNPPEGNVEQPFLDPSVMETLLDSAIGFTQGATGGGADEFLNWLDPDAGQLYRDEMRVSRDRSPWAFHGAQAVGGAPAAMAGGEVAALFAAPAKLGALAYNMGLGAVEGGLSAEGDGWDRAAGAGRGLVAAGALHGVGEGIGLLGQAGKKAEHLWQAASNEARNSVFGEPGDYKRLADSRGLDYAFDGPAGIVEELDLANKWVPQSARDYANKLEGIKKSVGPEMAENLEVAGADPRTHVLRDMPRELGSNMPPPMEAAGRESTSQSMLADELLGPQPELATDVQLRQSPEPSVAGALQELERAAPNGTDMGDSLSSAYGRLRGRLPEAVPPVLEPKRLNELKTAYQDQAYEGAKAGDTPGSIAEQSAGNAARATNDLLKGALAKHPDPEHLARHENLSQTYSDSSLLEEMARNKAAGTQGQAAGTGLWGTLSAPITRKVRQYGPDFTANVMQRGADAAGATAKAITPGVVEGVGKAAAYANAPIVQAAGRWGGQEPRVRQNVLAALESAPEQLGAYAQRLQQAASSPSETAIDDEITRLIQTEPEFRTYYLPMLRVGGG
jgi:hypothetical protein